MTPELSEDLLEYALELHGPALSEQPNVIGLGIRAHPRGQGLVLAVYVAAPKDGSASDSGTQLPRSVRVVWREREYEVPVWSFEAGEVRLHGASRD